MWEREVGIAGGNPMLSRSRRRVVLRLPDATSWRQNEPAARTQRSEDIIMSTTTTPKPFQAYRHPWCSMRLLGVYDEKLLITAVTP